MKTVTVIESNNETAVIALVSAKTLKARLAKLGDDSKANTLSLAYYTMINGNVAPLGTCDQSISNLLDKSYRQFVCAKFTDGKWVYNKAKATKLITELGLSYNVSTFAEFVDSIEANELTLAAKKLAKEEELKALDPITKLAQDKDRVTKYLMNCGLTQVQLKDIVLALEHEKSKAVAKSIQSVSAA